MKRCCKRIDITNRILVERAVRDCISGKMNRGDIIRMFSEYSKLPREIIKKDLQRALHDGRIDQYCYRRYTTRNY